jgi:RNA polymerase-binding transcription factor DksA
MTGPSPISESNMMRPDEHGPQWRGLLETRWQERLAEVTELSLAYHGAAAAAGQRDTDEARLLLRRAVAARRKLADTEEALGRLSSGRFGRCEQCGSQIPGDLLLTVPEARYCSACAVPGQALAAAAASRR